MRYTNPRTLLFTFHYPPFYNIKRSPVNVYKIDGGRSVRVKSTRWSQILQTQIRNEDIVD